MDPALHKAAVQGSVTSLRKLVAERHDILDSKTPWENTALHIAVQLGHARFAKEVLAVNDKLLVSKNADGDTPLHLAARAGKVNVVELLIDRGRLWPPETALSSMANKDGDTPLHVAVKHGRSAVALRLLAAEPSQGYALNAKKQSPLHIAAGKGLADVVEQIIRQPWAADEMLLVPSGPGGDGGLYQAVLGGHTRVVEILLRDTTPERQIVLTDASQNNALHYAAQKNNASIVKLLLNRKPDLAYKRNSDLQSPLHVAAHYGSTEAMAELLKQCPDVAAIVDSKGRNAIQVAVTSGKVDCLRCLLDPEHVLPEEIVNHVDHDGNTPLHLAATYSRIQSALLLLKDPRVNPCVLNREGHTARSIIEKRARTEEMDTYEMYVWKKLVKHEACRCKKELLPPVATYESHYQLSSVDTYMMSTVAALIVTVSFAANFTMPGGYNQTDGTAIHGHKLAFQIFVISNIVAMCSSIVVVFCFIWDPAKFKINQLMWGHKLTVLACLAMVVSLITAVYVTLAPTARWPAYVVIAIGASTPAVVFLIVGGVALSGPVTHKRRLRIENTVLAEPDPTGQRSTHATSSVHV